MKNILISIRTVNELAKELGMHRTTVYRKLKNKELKPYYFNKGIIVDIGDVEKFEGGKR